MVNMTKGTKVTSKYQTSIPKEVRKLLDIKPGKEVGWNIVRGMVIVDMPRKIQHPTKFLTSQLQTDIDAVKLVRAAREDFK